MIKKIISVILILSFTLTLTSCKGKEPDNTDSGEYVLPTEIIDSDISLPYTSADSLAPYSAKSGLNRDLIPIIYESLFNETTDGKGVRELCESFETKGMVITVKLLKSVLFSDGSKLTATDVLNSYNSAKSNAYYKDSLKIFSSVKVIDNYTLNFVLKYNDLMAINTLSFPVCKASGKFFIGTGKYSLSYLEKRPYLSVNTNHRDFKTSWNKQITLYDMAGITSPVYSFKANDISVYKNDLSSADYVNLSSETVGVDMNSLVYIGINSQWKGSIASIKWVRQAINIGINRRTVTASSFLGQGTATQTPFPSGFYALEGAELPSIDGEMQGAVNILSRNGYSKVNSDGVRLNGDRKLAISILVCSRNEYKVNVAQAVKESLEGFGFKVTINERKTLAEYKAALEDGKYSLYIGEAGLTSNCDLSPFFTEKGVCNYGIDKGFYKEYSDYKKGEISTTEFIQSFSTEVPFIPLFYRKAVVAINPNITGVDKNNIYTSVSDWEMNDK